MTPLSDAAMARLRSAAALPELPDARYSLLQVLGEGGMGTVYLGRDELLERDVAIKVARDAIGPGSAVLAERLRTEARVLARLEHAGIVPVHDAGLLADGRVFYVMKRVHGRTLETVLETMPELDRRLGVLERVADAVAFAHGQGVVHRDLKPANVMVGEFGEVLVMDWGVAKLLGTPEAARVGAGVAAPGRTDPGSVLGTPGFMPPEQAAAGLVDRRADVFGLGALLVFLVTGTVPSSVAPPHQLLEADRQVPRRLRAIAARCLAADPADRYADAAEVAEEIRQYRSGGRVRAYREGWPERVGRVVSIYRTPILLVLAYLLMRVVVAWLGRLR